MNNELDTILRTLERDRGIGREAMLATIANALQAAAKKSLLTSNDVRVEIDPRTLEIRAWERRLVDDAVLGTAYVSLADARRIKPDAQIGDTIETPVSPRIFGRIAAQTAKQAIIQGIHDSERDIMERKYADQVGKIVSATVRQIVRKDVICDVNGGGEAILKGRDRLKSDRLNPGDEIRAVIRFVGMEQDPRRVEEGEAADGTVLLPGHRRVKYIDEPANNPCVKLSRTDPSFVVALFREQSTEIKDGVVEVVSIARQAGIRTKLAVRSNDKKVDPVGACVGVRGSRIKPVINELNGEKLDVVEWDADMAKFAKAALAPAAVQRVSLDPEARLVTAYVEHGGLTPAIGKGGVNTKLAAELIGWNVSVKELGEDGETEEDRAAKLERFRRDFENKVAALAETLGSSAEVANAIAVRGYLTVEGIISSMRDEFVANMGRDAEDSAGNAVPTLDPESARAVWETAEEIVLSRGAPAAEVPAAEEPAAEESAPAGEGPEA